MPRVFLGPVEVAGMLEGMRAGFEAHGCHCTVVDLQRHRFGYGNARPNLLTRLLANLLAFRARTPGLARIPLVAVEIPLRLAFVAWAAARHDIFVFTARSSMLWLMDLPLLRLLGRKVVFVFFGSDSRPPYMDGFQDFSVAEQAHRTRRMKADFRRIERHADAVVCCPAAAHLLERPFINLFQVGLAIIPSQPAVPRDSGLAPRAVRILHAPSDKKGKGTAHIHGIIDALKQGGFDIEYREISNQPHAVVLDMLEWCDFVIDQAYSDVPMSAFPAEALMRGRTAVVGGYFGSHLGALMKPEDIPPTFYCRPEDMLEQVKALVCDRDLRVEAGKKGHRFVVENWTASSVAERYLRICAGDIPPHWLINPAQLRYCEGGGLSKEGAAARVRDYIAANGEEALYLADKAAMKSALVGFSWEVGNA